jgi:molybdenum cofactor biosynthesis enzyme
VGRNTHTELTSQVSRSRGQAIQTALAALMCNAKGTHCFTERCHLLLVSLYRAMFSNIKINMAVDLKSRQVAKTSISHVLEERKAAIYRANFGVLKPEVYFNTRPPAIF